MKSRTFLFMCLYPFVMSAFLSWLFLPHPFAIVYYKGLLAVAVIFAPIIYHQWSTLRKRERR